jgi:hypothetical protein
MVIPTSIRAHPERLLNDLVIGVIASRPAWLGVCCWCLGVICQPANTGGQWHHVHHGFLLCAHPLPGAPLYAMACPLPDGDAVGHLRHLLAPPADPTVLRRGDGGQVGQRLLRLAPGAAVDRAPRRAKG